MKIQSICIHRYDLPLASKFSRSGLLIKIENEQGDSGWGEIAPLPNRSPETLEDALRQLQKNERAIKEACWNSSNVFQKLAALNFYPSLTFGLESALLSLLSPLSKYSVPASALLMGTSEEILFQAEKRHNEGFTSAKVKVSHLSFKDAAEIIKRLKNVFHLRIDVNRAWKTDDSLRFFEQFPLDTFDYVEEPFFNPKELALFPHPLAIDESYPSCFNLEQLERLPKLKAVIYKPTIQGGISGCLSLHEWTSKLGIDLILSSSFESDLGLAHIASIGHRLSLSKPIGIGTYFFLKQELCTPPLRFSSSLVFIPSQPVPDLARLQRY